MSGGVYRNQHTAAYIPRDSVKAAGEKHAAIGYFSSYAASNKRPRFHVETPEETATL